MDLWLFFFHEASILLPAATGHHRREALSPCDAPATAGLGSFDLRSVSITLSEPAASARVVPNVLGFLFFKYKDVIKEADLFAGRLVFLCSFS